MELGGVFFSYSNINHEISSKPFKLSVPQFVSLVTEGFKVSTMWYLTYVYIYMLKSEYLVLEFNASAIFDNL